MSTEAATTTTPKNADAARQISLVQLSLLAIAVGIVGGVGAVVFRGLIALFHNFSFLGIFSVIYDANVFTAPSPWGAAVILAPVIGSILVTLLVTRFAPEAKGHGVPEVMDAIYYNQGKIRPVVAVVKSLASAICIGTGGAVGREGPIIQIGASFGSTIGQIIRMAPWQRITLVAAGAGAGIAATFNTPIGGVMFAIELMMPEVSVRTFLPVALSTGTATFIANLVLGPQPAFSVPAQALIGSHPASLSALLLFALLGIIIGLAATIFVRAIPFADDQFDRIKNPYLRHALGMVAVGVLFYTLYRIFGHYYVEGVGYATIQALLLGQMTTLLYILPLLYICKLIATSLTLGSGGSGGIFSPSLFMGATLGGAFGAVVDAIHPVAGASPGTLAIVGMAAMVGGGTGAVMTAVTMIFEMTRDYGIVMPMIVAVALSVGVRRMLSRENIYTIKLVDRGHYIPKALHANMFLVRHAADVMDSDVLVLPASADFDGFLRQPTHKGAFKHVVVTEGDRIVGVLRVNTAFRRGLEDTSTGVTLGDVAQKNFVVADADEIVFDVIERMWREGAAMAVVVRSHGKARASDVRGMISKEHVADSVAESIRPYGAA
ncbi:MAG: chloride channel protein [Alphaproteobacteria bacterium]|nr:chloride channel protein [Alphaproteobacteria bacterium]